MQPLVEAGYVAFAYGGAEQGKFLCNHKLIDKVHLTGSANTYDAIVWGGKTKVSRTLFKSPDCSLQRYYYAGIVLCFISTRISGLQQACYFG